MPSQKIHWFHGLLLVVCLAAVPQPAFAAKKKAKKPAKAAAKSAPPAREVTETPAASPARGEKSPEPEVAVTTPEAAPATESQEPLSPAKKPERKKGKKAEQTAAQETEVDLSEIDAIPPPAPGPMGYSAGRPGTQPSFLSSAMLKVYFDFLLQIRSGINPLSFDFYHNFLFVEFAPTPQLQFSFDVNPTPNFFEFAYQLTPRWQVRAGKIYIPFDDTNPHTVFGGLVNVTRLMQPTASSFLPDVWADLGVATKLHLIDSPNFDFFTHLYIVNGFGQGGTDPKNELGSRYANFGKTGVTDNNADKAIGVRFQGTWRKFLSLGTSAYTCRYTDTKEPDRRIVMLGFDTQLQPVPGTLLRFGYAYMKVGLLPEAAAESFTRGGLYAEVTQRLPANFKLRLRGGLAQNDSRVIDVSDQQYGGVEAIYEQQWFQIALQLYRDFKNVPNKVNYDFSALRLSIML